MKTKQGQNADQSKLHGLLVYLILRLLTTISPIKTMSECNQVLNAGCLQHCLTEVICSKHDMTHLIILTRFASSGS